MKVMYANKPNKVLLLNDHFNNKKKQQKKTGDVSDHGRISITR